MKTTKNAFQWIIMGLTGCLLTQTMSGNWQRYCHQVTRERSTWKRLDRAVYAFQVNIATAKKGHTGDD